MGLSKGKFAAIERYLDRALPVGLEPEDIVNDVEIRIPAARLFLCGEEDDAIVAVLEGSPREASPSTWPPGALVA